MYLFKTKRALRLEIESLRQQRQEAWSARDDAMLELKESIKERTRLQTCMQTVNDKRRKLESRVKAQQQIIDNLNSQLGLTHTPASQRKSEKKGENKTTRKIDHDPFIEE